MPDPLMTDPLIAYHFLRANMTSPNAPRTKWTVGQTRSLRGGEIIPCRRGYHGSPTLWDAIEYAPGPVACMVELSGEVIPHGAPVDKYAARSRRLLAAVNIERELRLFAADCAEHVLHLFEAEYSADDRPRQAIQAARDYANGLIDDNQLRKARDVANTATSAAYVAHAAAYVANTESLAAAYHVATSAANNAAIATSAAYAFTDTTAYTAERDWQRQRWDHYTAHIFDGLG